MKNKTICHYCGTMNGQHWHGMFVEGKFVEMCHDCYSGVTPKEINLHNIDKLQSRANHWKDIKSRVKTHEGEFLTGEKGQAYQQKWSKQYLGVDLGQARQITKTDVEKYVRTKT